MDWKRKLGVASVEEVEDLKDRVEELEELKDRLREEVIDDEPQLSYVLELLRDGAEGRPALVEELMDKFDISQATAYRRLETLEKELQFIRERQDGKLESIVDSSQGIEKQKHF